jgi:6-phosphogluconolactonase (cycloisomerase 2 family)
VITVGSKPYAIAIAANNLVYVTNGADDTISVLTISAADGTLSYALGGAMFDTGNTPDAIAISAHGGLYAYATNRVDGNVSQFSVNADGSLSAMSPATVAAGDTPTSIAFDRSGKFVYVTNVGDKTVSQYSVGSNGTLTALTPSTVPAGSAPTAIATGQ